MSEIVLTKENFDSEVLHSEIPVLIDFWATWCGPCRMIAPFIEEIAKENDGKVKVCKVNVDDENELAVQFGITAIPTVIVIKDGKNVNTAVGYRTKEQLEELLK